ncbi:MAG: rRNA maturation RNase YbeY, partial [Candidatus Neomarinimicrobiota bacterium]
MITTQVDTLDGEPPPLAVETVAALVAAVLAGEGTSDGRVQIVFSNDEQLRDMQRRFFNRDTYTDVIAFNLNEQGEPLEGEIYISPQRARENSQEYDEPYERELRRLVAHGSLHLLG